MQGPGAGWNFWEELSWSRWSINDISISISVPVLITVSLPSPTSLECAFQKATQTALKLTFLVALCLECFAAPFWRAGWVSGLSRSWLEAGTGSGAVLWSSPSSRLAPAGCGCTAQGLLALAPTQHQPSTLPTPLLWHFPRKIGKPSSFCRVCLRGRQCSMDPVRSMLIFWNCLGKPLSYSYTFRRDGVALSTHLFEKK